MKKRLDYPFNISSIRDSRYLERHVVTPEKGKYILGIGLTSRCNFDCPICYYHSNANLLFEETDMQLSILREILLNCSPLKCINFALEGEPFCYPYLFQALDYAMDASESISISTNGSLLTRDKIFHLSEYNFSLFSLSIDAADNHSYTYFHKGGSLSNFLHNAEMSVDIIGPSVIFNTVLCQQNLSSLLELPRLAAMVGVSTISIMQIRMHKACWEKGIKPVKLDNLLYYLEKIAENADRYNIKLYFDSSFDKENITNCLEDKGSNLIKIEHKNKKCTIPWYYTSILSTGEIFPCCGDFKPEKINTYTFDGIFNHEYLIMLRGNIYENKYIKACKKCF